MRSKLFRRTRPTTTLGPVRHESGKEYDHAKKSSVRLDPATDPDEPHTNLAIGGATRVSRGSAIQMAAGYEGLGKGSAGGGTNIIYDIYALRFGNSNSSSMHYIQWIHKLGLGGSCSY